jgi:transglutaminase-like putative cysteine protease
MKPSPASRWDLPSAAILLAAILTSAARLAVTTWTPYLHYIPILALPATLLGLALGQSRFTPRQVLLLAAGYTLTVVPWQLSRALPDVPLLADRLLDLAGRLLFALSEFSRGLPVEDPLFFVTLLSLVYWVIGLHAGYALTRRGSLLASTLPAGALLLVIQVYDSYFVERIFFLAVFAFLTIALQGRLSYLRQREGWILGRVFIAREAGPTLAGRTLVAAALLVTLAWTLPAALSPSPWVTRLWDQVSESWRKPSDRLGDAFAALEGTGGVGYTYYGDQMALGTATLLSDTVLFTVRPAAQNPELPRYYWRGRVYDTYTHGQWENSQSASRPFSPQQANLVIPDNGSRRLADFTVTTFLKQHSLLYTMAQPVWVNRPATSVFFLTPQGEVDLLLLRASEPYEVGDTYRTRAAVASPTVAELRAAGEDYPSWVTEKYLQLPENLSARIPILALQLTVGETTPYDKAAAITSYLRSQIRYSPSVISAPAGMDPLEWFLFDYRQGFCNYYATAQVILLRSVGVPARLAVGFAQGEFDPILSAYTVRQRDAHAWPEVYFPGIGWVEFEPTGNQESLLRPAGLPAAEVEEPAEPQERELPEPLDEEPGFVVDALPLDGDLSPVIPPVEPVAAAEEGVPGWQSSVRNTALALGLAALAWLFSRRYNLATRLPVTVKQTLEYNGVSVPRWLDRWAVYAGLGRMERTYAAVPRGLRWLGGQPSGSDTPAEQAAALSRLLPQAAPAIQELLDEYQQTLYGSQPGSLARARSSAGVVTRNTLTAALRRRLLKVLGKLIPDLE